MAWYGHWLLVAGLSGCAIAPDTPSLAPEPAPSAATSDDGPTATNDTTISGVVIDRETREPLDSALVVLQSTALPGTRETQTNDKGLYAFRNLPPGTYTIQVLYQQADIAKVMTLARGVNFRANFGIDPDDDGIVCDLPGDWYRPLDESLLSVDADEARLRGLPRTRRGL